MLTQIPSLQVWPGWNGHSCAPPSWAGNLGGGSCLTSSRGAPGGGAVAPDLPQVVTFSNKVSSTSPKQYNNLKPNYQQHTNPLTRAQTQTQTQTQMQTQTSKQTQTQEQIHTPTTAQAKTNKQSNKHTQILLQSSTAVPSEVTRVSRCAKRERTILK